MKQRKSLGESELIPKWLSGTQNTTREKRERMTYGLKEWKQKKEEKIKSIKDAFMVV